VVAAPFEEDLTPPLAGLSLPVASQSQAPPPAANG